jgi:DNA polymerase-3 subunit epsilon
MLFDKPVFADIYQAFEEFIGSSPWIVFKATFITSFIKAEFKKLGKDKPNPKIDQIENMKGQKIKGDRSFNNLSQHFKVQRDGRGALADSKALAVLYVGLVSEGAEI